MILSCDYTTIVRRIAALSDDVLERLLQKYPLSSFQDPLKSAKAIEGNVQAWAGAQSDLMTEWVLKSIHESDGRERSIRRFRDAARFFLDVKATPKFKKVAAEYSRENGKMVSPRNILNFNLWDLEEIAERYNIPEPDKFQAKLPRGSKLIYDGGLYQIVEVSTVEAACALGDSTDWCTRHPDAARGYLFPDEEQYEPDEDDDYDPDDEYVNGESTSDSPLYVIYRNRRKIAQFHNNWGEAKLELHDLKNEPIAPDEGLSRALYDSGLLTDVWNYIAEKLRSGRMGLDNYQYAQRWMRFPRAEVEQFALKNPRMAALYAAHVLGGPFPAAEEGIAKIPSVALFYANRVVGRFPAGEPAIARGTATEVISYVENTLMERFPSGENKIFNDYEGYFIKPYMQALEKVDPEGLAQLKQERGLE